MANRMLNIIFRADTSQAKGAINELKGEPGGEGIGGLTGALMDLINPAELVIGAIGTLGVMARQQAGEWIDYTLSVGELRDTLQLTTEQASTLSAVMRENNVSANAMMAAYKAMSKEGLDPTISSLKEVLYEYDNLTDGAEKLEYAQKMLSSQGVNDLLPMWNQLTEAQKMAFGTQEKGIEITEDNIKAARELEEAQQSLDLTLEKVGGALVTYWYNSTKVADGLRELVHLQPIVAEGAEETARSGQHSADQLFENYRQIERLIPQLEILTKKWGDHAKALSSATEKQQAWNQAQLDAQSAWEYHKGELYFESIEDLYIPGDMPGHGPVQGPGPVGGGNLADEVRRMVDTLPVLMADAIEKAKE